METTTAPALQLPTKRGLLKMLIFTPLTLGIYPLVIYSRISSEINTVASRHDGKHTMHFCIIYFLLAVITLGIAPIVWFHKICGRIGCELKRRGIDYSFGSSSFWLWNVLGCLIIVGPCVFIHKFLKAMNLLNADYNQKG